MIKFSKGIFEEFFILLFKFRFLFTETYIDIIGKTFSSTPLIIMKVKWVTDYNLCTNFIPLVDKRGGRGNRTNVCVCSHFKFANGNLVSCKSQDGFFCVFLHWSYLFTVIWVWERQIALVNAPKQNRSTEGYSMARDMTFLSWPFTEFDITNKGFHGACATGVACRQGTLTPPNTWSCPTLGLACVLMSRPISPELVLSPDLWISNTRRYFSFA